jgi:hypothetical protein
MPKRVERKAQSSTEDSLCDQLPAYFTRIKIGSRIPSVNDYNLWALQTNLDQASAVAILQALQQLHAGNRYWLIDTGYTEGDVYAMKCHYTICQGFFTE